MHRGAGGAFDEAARRAAAELAGRIDRFRGGAGATILAGRHVAIVDDGITLAVPVAPRGRQDRSAGLADEMIAVATPRSFGSVGRFYRDFSQTSDDEVLTALAEAAERSGR